MRSESAAVSGISVSPTPLATSLDRVASDSAPRRTSCMRHIKQAPRTWSARQCPSPQREKRTDIGSCQIRRAQLVTKGTTDRGETLRAPGEHETILEELSLGQLQHAERERDDGGVQAAGEEAGHQSLAWRFHDFELDAGRGILQVGQDSRKQVGSKSGDDPDRDPERTRLVSLPHGLQQKCLVQDPERLLVRLSAERREENAAALALHQRPSERGLELANLERKRGLRNVNALGRPAERAVLDQGLKVA